MKVCRYAVCMYVCQQLFNESHKGHTSLVGYHDGPRSPPSLYPKMNERTKKMNKRRQCINGVISNSSLQRRTRKEAKKRNGNLWQGENNTELNSPPFSPSLYHIDIIHGRHSDFPKSHVRTLLIVLFRIFDMICASIFSIPASRSISSSA